MKTLYTVAASINFLSMLMNAAGGHAWMALVAGALFVVCAQAARETK